MLKSRYRVKQYVMLALFISVAICSFGCAPGNEEEAQREKRNEQLLKGYGNRDTSLHPIKFPAIKR